MPSTQGLHETSVLGGARGEDTELSVRSLERHLWSMIRVRLLMSVQRAGVQLPEDVVGRCKERDDKEISPFILKT